MRSASRTVSAPRPVFIRAKSRAADESRVTRERAREKALSAAANQENRVRFCGVPVLRRERKTSIFSPPTHGRKRHAGGGQPPQPRDLSLRLSGSKAHGIPVRRNSGSPSNGRRSTS